MSVELVCSVCGKPYNGGTDRYVCPFCGASIEPREDISPERKDLKELLLRGGNGEKGVWKYRAFFPGFEDIEPVTMEEGNTPLIHAKALGAAYGMSGLYLKNETANPSATYKDRFAALAISQYKHENASAVALGSAGNAGSAVAAYAAKAGIPMPTISSALAYFDGYTTGRLPANLLQAQRDYFGAHTYERVDDERGKFFHTNWTGHGGDTAAGTYNA